jgi:hypothetical protein
VLGTVREISSSETLVKIDLEERGKSIAIVKVFFDMCEVFVVGASLVSLNEIDKLLLRDLKLLSSPLGIFHRGIFSVRLF